MNLIHLGRHSPSIWKTVSPEVQKYIESTKNVGLYDILMKEKGITLSQWKEADDVRTAIEKDVSTFDRKIDLARNDREEELDWQIKCECHV